MKPALFFGKTAARLLASVRPLALLTALLLAPWGRLSAQALPTFTYAGVCGEGTVGNGNGLRINQNVQDVAGNNYVTGYFRDSAVFGAFVLRGVGGNMFVAKLNPVGTVVWAVRVGRAYGTGIAVDANGNILVVGAFSDTAIFGNFPLTSTGINSYFQNAYMAKLSPNGTFVWAVRAGGMSDNSSNGITVDAAGNSYVCGTYNSSIGIADFGPFRLVSINTSKDVFVAKLDPTGTFLWVASGGGGLSDEANGIALDAAGSIFITGFVEGSFGTISRFGPATITSAGSQDILVAKLSPNGVFQWATGAGGRTEDFGQRLAVDTQGIVHVVGFFSSSQAVFGTITLQYPNQGTFDAFVATLTPAGVWQWAVQGGGPGDDYGYDLALDVAGNTYAVGSCSYRADFGNTVLTTPGDQDVFVCKINPTGTYVWAIQAGGTGDDKVTGVALNAANSLTLTGSTLSGLAIFGTQGFGGNPAADTGFLARLAVGPLSTTASQNPPILALWPNPARGGEEIYIKGFTTRQPIEVLDMLGRVVLVASAPIAGAVVIMLPAGLSGGVYLVRAGQQACRFTVQ